MKKFFRLVSMLAVAGLTFAYTSCTDYSEDVNRLDERIDGHVADVNTQIDALKKTDEGLQSSINAANDAIKALQDNTASLKEELTKLSEKHDADIKALEATHAADKAALEKQLADKATELKTALETLDAKYAQKVSDLEAAYKQADTELKNQILQNSTKIATLESEVKNIKEVLIPAVEKQVNDLAAKADETYATKVALTDSTAKLAARITSEVEGLNASIKSVSDRLTTLEAAHETLKESFNETKAEHATAISDLQTKLAALEESHATDIETVKGLVADAKTAADAAQTAADAAQEAADKAQATANTAMAEAGKAALAAQRAQATANTALGEVKELKEALGVYAKKGELEAKILELVNADIALAAKDIELALADSFNAANLEAAKEAINAKIDTLSENVYAKIKNMLDLMKVEDGKLQAQINDLVEKKFNKADFADEFKKAYELRFTNDFNTAFEPAFAEAFKTAWDTNFQPAFDTAFDAAWTTYFQPAFDGAFAKAIAAAIEDDGVVGAKIKEEVNAAKTELEGKIQEAESKLQAQLDIVNTKVGDILLVVGKLAERIQSITFVPEYYADYEQFAATLYYYVTPIEGADGKDILVPISDNKTVVAKFEVYPKSQAPKVAEMLKSGNGASLVAVPLKAYETRGAAEAPKATIKSAVAANGVVSIEAVFGADVPYDFEYNAWGEDPKDKNAVSFAISLRVESPAETVVRDGVTETSGTSVDAGKYIESAYVPVKISKNSLVEGFCLYDFEKEVMFEDGTRVKYEWSNPENQWNYFAGYDYAVMMYDRTGKDCFKTLAEAAEMMNIDVKVITPKFTVKPEVRKLGGTTPVVTPANAKYFTPKANTKGLIDFATLADCNIAMDTDVVKAEPKLAVGNVMEHCVDFKIENIGNVCHYDVYYEIIRRQVIFNVEPFEGKNRIDWSYAKAVELSTGKTFAEAYNNPIKFEECSVERIDENNDYKTNLGDILKLTPTYEVTVNGVKQTIPATTTPIEIDKVAHLVADVAEVRIPGGAYKFAVADKNIEVKSVYRVEDNATDYNVIFKYVLGAMPGNQVVLLPAKAIDFTTGKTEFVATYTPDEYRKHLVDAIGSYFKDAKTLWTSVIEEEVVTKRLYWKNKTVLLPDASSAHSINILADGVNVKVARKYLEDFSDTFGFTAVNETWYGVNYTFTTFDKDYAGITFVKPAFRLAPAPDRLTDNWTGTILHEAKYDKYVLKQDIDLSKYVTVKDYDGKETELTITYEQVTVADAANGIVNVPVINTTKVAVIPNTAAPAFPTIESSFINWLTWSTSDKRGTSFTAREDRIQATLKLEGILLDRNTMTLSTARPITKFAFDKFVQTIPEGSTSTTVKLWNKMIIEGVLEEGNIAKQDAATLTGAIYNTVKGKKSNPNTYDCEVIFPDASKVAVYVGGEKMDIYSQKKFSYDPANGTITFTGDLADLVKPVEFKFEATLNYVLDRVHKDQLPATVSVTFQK